MNRAAKPRTTYHWRISHPLHPAVPVNADTWEEAVAKAAALWGVPFAKVAAMCEAEQKTPMTVTTCPKCGREVFNNSDQDGWCDLCRKKWKAERERVRAVRRKYWYELPKYNGGR